MIGKILNRNGRLFVLYESPHENEPFVTYLWYAIESTTANPYSGYRPEEGDLVRYTSHGRWVVESRIGAGSVDTGAGDRPAAHKETVSVPCPPTRGKEARWNRGRWEKLLKKGWVPV